MWQTPHFLSDEKTVMKDISYNAARLATALFFAAPGISYGLFASRLPFIKTQIGATESDVGLILFSWGLMAAIGLATAPMITKKIPIKVILIAGLITLCTALTAAAFIESVALFIIVLAPFGFAMGILDVTMNMQGIAIERHYLKPTLGVLHASYSFGGVTGSLLGSLFAALSLSPKENFMIPSIVLLIAGFLARNYLIAPKEENATSEKKKSTKFFSWLLFACGLFSLVAYVAEGVCGDWGSLFLVHERAAPESSAALSYGLVAAMCFLSRLASDRLRELFGDFRFAFISAVIFLGGATLILLSGSWLTALIGFAIVGIGLGPLVPTLFSFVGRLPGLDAKTSIATVSFTGYAGLLMFPPIFGFLAHHWNYEAIFWVELVIAFCCIAGVFLFRKAR